MNRKILGMAPGGRMALDRAANRRKVLWHRQQKQAVKGKESKA